MNRKGVILAAGMGGRLYPATSCISKQLLPIYDKPMVYYPLSTLMLAGIREILLVATLRDLPLYQQLFGTGHQWGLSIEYLPVLSHHRHGIVGSLLVAQNFIKGHPCAMILGDNLFYGEGLTALLAQADANAEGATVLAYPVTEPQHFGVVELGRKGRILSLEEKPLQPKSHFAVTGLYFYDDTVSERAMEVTPSERNELEVTDLNRLYLDQDQLLVHCMSEEITWLDAGTPASLLQAANFVASVEARQGVKVACPEEIAWRQAWISDRELAALGHDMNGTEYGQYCLNILPVEDRT